MSTGSLAALASKAASRDNVDLSSTSLPDVPELDSFMASPPRRPSLTSASKLAASGSRHALSRIPSEATNHLPSLETSTSTPGPSRLQSFVSEMNAPDDTPNLSALDTPVRERRGFDENLTAAKDKRGRSSLGGPPHRQMTLREQEKVIDVIKKENFSLQMKVHLLEERLGQLAPEHMEATFSANVRLKMEVHSRGLEIKKLKKLLLDLEKALSEANEREKEKAAGTGHVSATVERLESELDKKDDEIRELKKKLRVADSAKQASLATSSSQPGLRRLQEDNTALVERQAELEEELDRNRRHLEETTDDLEDLRSTLQRQKEEAESDDTRRRVEELELENEELGKRNDACIAALQERDEDQEILKEEIDHLRAELEEVERKRRAEASDRSVSRAEIMEEREDKEALEQNANELRDKWAAANIELEQKEDEIEELRAIQDAMEADFQRILGEHEATIEDQEEHIQVLENEKVDLQNTLDELHDKVEKTIQHMHQQIAEKEAEKEAELRERDEARDQEMIAANAEIGAQGKRIWELEEDLEAERDALDRLRHEFDDRTEEHDRIVRALKEKIADKNAELGEIREMYGHCRQQVVAHSDRCAQLEQHLKKVTDEEDAERNARLKAQEDVRRLEDRLDGVEALLREEEGRSRKELEDSERRRRRDVAELENASKEAQANIQSLQKLLSQRDEDVAALQSALNSLESESRKLGESHTTDRFALELELERARRDLTSAEANLERVRSEANSRDERGRDRENAIDKLHAENRELATQLAAQTQARLNLSDKLDLVQSHSKTTEAELAELRNRYADIEKRLSKDQRQLQSQENNYRDQLTERNTLLLTIYQYLDKILGADKTPKKGAVATRPVTNFALFHEDLLSRIKAISQISLDFDRRCKVIEQKFVEKFNELRKQLDHRWKQIDRFEAGLKTATEKRDAWRRKYHTKEGELEAAKASNSEISSQLASLRRTGASGSSELTAAESKGMATRVSNAERRAAHASNVALRKDEELAAEKQKARLNEERYIARIKELERRSENEHEKLKQEKHGAKEAMAVVQKDVDTLRDQLAQTKKREEQLVVALDRANVALPSSAPEKRPGR